jgi:hypothetical protein
MADGQVDLLLDVGGALVGREFNVDVARGCAQRGAQVLVESDAGIVGAVVVTALGADGAAGHDAGQGGLLDQARGGLLILRVVSAVEEMVDSELDHVGAAILGGLGFAEGGRGVGDEDGHAEQGHVRSSLRHKPNRDCEGADITLVAIGPNRRGSGDVPARPRPLEVEAADAHVHVADLAADVQSGHTRDSMVSQVEFSKGDARRR